MWQGANSYGQLAHGDTEDRSSPESVLVQIDNVSAVSGGGGHTFMVSGNGDCMACGWNSKGQLGIGCEETNITTPCPLSFPLVTHKIIKAVGGWDFSFFITDRGELYSCGNNAFGQLGIDNCSSTPRPTVIPHPCPVKDVACGMRHTVLVDVQGDVYTCGTGRRGQLGVTTAESLQQSVACFTKVSIPGLNAVKSVAGAYHSAIITDTGQVVVWGDNKHGQLGLGYTSKPLTSPTVIPQSALDDSPILQLSSGWTHMAAVTDKGRVLTWGRSDYGQLGVGSSTTSCGPHVVNIAKPSQLICGSEHCLAISESGSVFSWGWNEHGICGTGDEVNRFEPHLLSMFDNHKALGIGTGAGHSFVISHTR